MDEVSIGLAFMAGVLSFLSPCVLPLVPGYISFLSGVSLEELKGDTTPKKVLLKAGFTSIFFVMGFSVVFIALGASASFIGKLFADHIVVLTKVAGILIIVLGLHLLGIFKLGMLNYEKRLKVKSFSPGFFGAFLIGFAFGFGWTPCAGGNAEDAIARDAPTGSLFARVGHTFYYYRFRHRRFYEILPEIQEFYKVGRNNRGSLSYSYRGSYIFQQSRSSIKIRSASFL
jgi:cytochrome c biogenesis protein CcdA